MAMNADLGLKTRHAFLDTEVFRRFGHNLDHKVLRRLLEHVKNGVCVLHTTDITIREVTRQIKQKAEEVAGAVNKGNNELRKWYARGMRFPPPAMPPDVDAEELALRACNNFRAAIQSTWNATMHRATEIPASAIFDAYFKSEPPFDGAESKEFPDAFVVASLDQWCQKQLQTMYVVTQDQAMLRAVAKTRTLLPVSSIDDLLQMIVEAHDSQIVQRVAGILQARRIEVVERIEKWLPGCGTIYRGDLHDGEIVDHDVGDQPTEMREFHVISSSTERIEAVVKAKVNVRFDVQYLDTGSAFYDPENDEYINAETETDTFEDDVTVNALVAIDATDDAIEDVDILTRDIVLQEPYENYK